MRELRGYFGGLAMLRGVAVGALVPGGAGTLCLDGQLLLTRDN